VLLTHFIQKCRINVLVASDKLHEYKKPSVQYNFDKVVMLTTVICTAIIYSYSRLTIIN
jgi:hypothetical protein